MPRSIIVCLGAAGFALVGRLSAQALPSGLPSVESPTAVAYAEGGLAAKGDPVRDAQAPVRRGAPHLGVFASLATRNDGLRASFVTAGAAGSTGAMRYGVTVHWTELNDVADDPVVAEGLRIGDVRLQAALGRGIARDRFGVAASVSHTWSTIFGTSAATLSFGGAVAASVTDRLRVVMTLDGAGPATDYGSGAPRRRQSPLFQAGAGLDLGAVLPAHLYIDVRHRVGGGGFTAVVAAGDWAVARLLQARAGIRVQPRADDPDRTELVPGGGFRICARALALDYGFVAVGTENDLLPRHYFAASWSR